MGALCLLLAGALESVGLLFRGPLTSPGAAPARFLEVSLSPTFHLGWGLLLPAAMLQCFGWLAVYRWRRDSPQERWVFRAMILSITAIIVFLPVSGALGLTSHEASLAERAGEHGAVAWVAATAEGPFARNFLIVSVLAGLVAVGCWCRALVSVLGAGWAALLVLHTVTQSITAPVFGIWGYRLECVGSLAFVAACTVVAVRIWRDTVQRPSAADGSPVS
jgi:hypothetical protein